MHAAQQHVLVQAGQIHLRVLAQRIGHLLDLVALAVMLDMIGIGGQQADAENRADFFGGHVHDERVILSVGMELSADGYGQSFIKPGSSPAQRLLADDYIGSSS
ncbi:hypothetical protein SDC9_132257 [bioreactor metagenome]|uniref:Uncharacterized protein n=1 Tax=bioreactor metagenome TaxID=1076179 RepID=A0A645D7H8_9ZZZZ